MRRVTVEIVVKSVYLDTPVALLKRGLDYTYRPIGVQLMMQGFDCIPRNVSGARRVRRSLRSGKIPTCPSGSLISNETDVECDSIFLSSSPPSPTEILLTVYLARLYRLVEEGKLSIAAIARQYSRASCGLVEGGYQWHMLEEMFGRKALRLSTARIVTSECRTVHVALVPVYRGGRFSLREARCYLGVRPCRSVYELIIPEELDPHVELRLLGHAQEDARRKLAELLDAPYEDAGGAVRMGAGTWPLLSLPAIAWLNGLAGGEAVETIFAAYRRCGGPRLWPPRRLEYILYTGGRLSEPGLLEIKVVNK